MQNIDTYYESIRLVYNQIVAQPDRPRPWPTRLVNWLLVATGIVFGATLIPVIPLVVVLLGAQLGFTIGPFDLTQGSLRNFYILWPSATVFTFVLLLLAFFLDTKVDGSADDDNRSKSAQSLSSEQLTFIASYEAYKELRIYFVSHIDQHVENSWTALRRMLPTELRTRLIDGKEVIALSPYDEVSVSHQAIIRSSSAKRSSFSRQVVVAQEFLETFQKYPWLTVGETTTSTLQALISFPDKVLWRLKRREDLPAILAILECLSKFSYAYLPEHNTYLEQAAREKLQADGAKYLEEFVKNVVALPQYTPPEPPPTKKEASLGLIAKVRESGYPGLLTRFAAWFILLFVLLEVALHFLRQSYALTGDTVVTLVVGTSVAGAAAMTGILPRATKKK